MLYPPKAVFTYINNIDIVCPISNIIHNFGHEILKVETGFNLLVYQIDVFIPYVKFITAILSPDISFSNTPLIL